MVILFAVKIIVQTHQEKYDAIMFAIYISVGKNTSLASWWLLFLVIDGYPLNETIYIISLVSTTGHNKACHSLIIAAIHFSM